ncbi:hypothetical protein C823_006534 [Eubacterium plexicaudatum ASF492]|uniref:Uncharacterized protein n=1 Tax=Eubacterium plexicaudatum ASF492 TaxID=1235802 RepID=N2A800_9FIRM|nr:hypothetical protein C823_006534 [Eubacterium plexicaudatum ASF492]
MVNPAMIFKIKSMWDEFTRNHPKLPRFFQAAVSHPLEEGTVIEMTIQRPNGDTLTSNVKLTASDLDLLDQLKEMGTANMS